MIDPRTLTDARLRLHWAAQLASTVGRTLGCAVADDSHTSFRFDADADAIVQESLHRSGLRLRDLTLLLGDHELPLHGRTIDEAFAWIAEHAPGVRRELNMPLPDHPVADGAPFDASDCEALQELARYYREAAMLLRELHDDVRIWPHHFDIAVLMEFEGGAKTIGAGFSPGDDTIDEPYWYVNHWPRTTATSLPPLAGGGSWNTEGWLGAVLPVSRGGDAREFLRSAVAVSKTLIGLEPNSSA
jgi:hypothetical protein